VLNLDYAKRRYDAAIAEIERLKQSEFPYVHIRDALLQLETVFQGQRALLNKLTAKSSAAVVKNACSQSLAYLFNYTPFLGFILRATNVRNAFELYAPVFRLARKLLGDTTKLLLSSEWDYSPFVFMPTSDLPDCVLIGVPAFESANPLLVSLAGHELGHNIWNQQALGTKYDSMLRTEVLKAIKAQFWSEFETWYPKATQANLETSMFAKQAWLPAHAFAKRQLEETFCDMMGLRLFAEAYLHAFAYLLSPCVPGERTPLYPTITTRVENMLHAAGPLGVTPPVEYANLFEQQLPPSNPVMKLLASIADVAVKPLVDAVISEARTIADSKGLPVRSPAMIDSIVADLRRVMPADGTASLAELVNAGWILFHDTELWQDIPQIQPEDRPRVLNDLILKSCEVREFNERISAA
jgi:hypothetical protein